MIRLCWMCIQTKKDGCINLLAHCMQNLPAQTMNRYGVEYDMPVGIELKIGKNWLDLEEVDV